MSSLRAGRIASCSSVQLPRSLFSGLGVLALSVPIVLLTYEARHPELITRGARAFYVIAATP